MDDKRLYGGRQYSVFTHFCIVYALGFILVWLRKFMLPRDAHTADIAKAKIFIKPTGIL